MFGCLPGRAFLRRLIDLTKVVRFPHHLIRLTKACRQDILVWHNFLEHFNGKAFFLHEKWLLAQPLTLYTDAAGSKGYGAIFGTHWLYGEWPESWKKKHCIFGAFPIVLALHVWGRNMSDQCIMLFSDNVALVDVINK